MEKNEILFKFYKIYNIYKIYKIWIMEIWYIYKKKIENEDVWGKSNEHFGLLDMHLCIMVVCSTFHKLLFSMRLSDCVSVSIYRNMFQKQFNCTDFTKHGFYSSVDTATNHAFSN